MCCITEILYFSVSLWCITAYQKSWKSETSSLNQCVDLTWNDPTIADKVGLLLSVIAAMKISHLSLQITTVIWVWHNTTRRNVHHKILKSKNSRDYDNISTSLIKQCTSEFSDILIYVCNLTCISRIFAEWLKYGEVKPLYKKEDKEIPSNFHPISLFPTVSKKFKKDNVQSSRTSYH